MKLDTAIKGTKLFYIHPSIQPIFTVHFSCRWAGRLSGAAVWAVTPWTCHQFIAGPRRHANNHLHSHLRMIPSCQSPGVSVLGLREEAGPPRQKPCRHKESEDRGAHFYSLWSDPAGESCPQPPSVRPDTLPGGSGPLSCW